MSVEKERSGTQPPKVDSVPPCFMSSRLCCWVPAAWCAAPRPSLAAHPVKPSWWVGSHIGCYVEGSGYPPGLPTRTVLS